MGNHLRHPITSKVVEREGNEQYTAAVAAMNGFRESMEDAHCMVCTSKYGLFGVFDGHSGSQCSTFCGEMLPNELQNATIPISDEGLVDITLRIDDKFRSQCKESGCTACYFVVTPGPKPGDFSLQVANVGDSRIIVGRNGGAECISMTEDHKPSLPHEKERIERCGGTVAMDRVDGMLAMSRAMGDNEYKVSPGGPLEQKVIAKPDITHVQCTAADWVIVACDGVFESNFTNEEVVEFVKQQMEQNADDIAKVACAVCDEALKRGSTDNITCMVVQFKDGSAFRKDVEFIPGPYHPTKDNFRKAYKSMAEKAGLTLGRALEMRYDLIREQMAQRINALKSDTIKQGMQDEEMKSLQEELAYFKPGPMKLEGAARTQWFGQLAERLDPVEEDGIPGMNLDPATLERIRERLNAAGPEGLANLFNNVVADPDGDGDDCVPMQQDSSSSEAPKAKPKPSAKNSKKKGK
jgi:protein phosphatase|uniref:PPM-type phosphatase domain-containing protein n=1 Tax=Eutreptiella gymnastica TaxID=73025 RepID=A0A7S4GIL3_9EUGL